MTAYRSAPPPAAPSCSHSSAVRVSCQTMALWIGCPVARSHTTAVSRWLVIPSATTASGVTSAFASAPAITMRVFSHTSVASCSTQPALGKICRCSIWSDATGRPWWSNRMHRVDVVPWSSEAT